MTTINSINWMVNSKFRDGNPITVTESENSNPNEFMFEVDTTNNSDMVQILKGLVENIKGQKIFVERYIGVGSSVIVIENPILDSKTGLEYRDQTGINYGSGVNTIEEINTHELCGVDPINSDWDEVQASV